MSFRQKFMNFMYGRNGTDALAIASVVLYLILAFINMFVRSAILSAIELLPLIYAFFRMFSKNTFKRRAENQKFLSVWSKFTPHLILMRDRFKERKTSRFRTCPHCKAVLRLPIKKGSHEVRCPRCNEKFKVRVIF